MLHEYKRLEMALNDAEAAADMLEYGALAGGRSWTIYKGAFVLMASHHFSEIVGPARAAIPPRFWKAAIVWRQDSSPGSGV